MSPLFKFFRVVGSVCWCNVWKGGHNLNLFSPSLVTDCSHYHIVDVRRRRSNRPEEDECSRWEHRVESTREYSRARACSALSFQQAEKLLTRSNVEFKFYEPSVLSFIRFMVSPSQSRNLVDFKYFSAAVVDIDQLAFVLNDSKLTTWKDEGFEKSILHDV